MREPGEAFQPYGQPSRFESKIVRSITSAPGTTGTGVARTPLQALEGTITPSGLHFERSHDGIPDIDPDVHQLVIHGMVKRALSFTVESLSRYPMVSRVAFVECAGNGGALYQKTPAQLPLQGLHGLVSCAEWTGVPLAVLLDEAGIDPATKWVLAEGADAASMSRSVPLAKAMDDAVVALYQNGERIRPSNGYPMRLLLPGFEGNMNVKWLRRLKLVAAPLMTKDETSKCTITLPDGKSLQFVFAIEPKSVITRPSPGYKLDGAGIYEISGLAWSGYGKVAKVDVSADGGKSWAPAALQEPVPAQGADPVPAAVALGWRTDHAAKPGDRRHRLCAAQPRGVARAARCANLLSLQRIHQLACGSFRTIDPCLRVDCWPAQCCYARWLTLGRRPPILVVPSHRTMLPPGT